LRTLPARPGGEKKGKRLRKGVPHGPLITFHVPPAGPPWDREKKGGKRSKDRNGITSLGGPLERKIEEPPSIILFRLPPFPRAEGKKGGKRKRFNVDNFSFSPFSLQRKRNQPH